MRAPLLCWLEREEIPLPCGFDADYLEALEEVRRARMKPTN
jgi:hypothetical protein